MSLLSCCSVVEVTVGEIKSAWELAMEKVERLGRLSPEELGRQTEEKCESIGQVLADKYLGGLAAWQLDIELEKIGADDRDLVKRSLASKLIQAIELGNNDRLGRVMEGILALTQDHEAVGEIGHAIEQLFDEYRPLEEQASREMEKAAGDVLHQLRISGSAIGAVSPEFMSDYRENLDTSAEPYREKLEGLKGKLAAVS